MKTINAYYDIIAVGLIGFIFLFFVYLMITDKSKERCDKANGTLLHTGDRTICVAIQDGRIVEIKK